MADHTVVAMTALSRAPLGEITNTEGNTGSKARRSSKRGSAGSQAAAPLEEQLCREYAPDVAKRMLQCELQHMPKPDYMRDQAEINPRMRSVLIDWLVDVHKEYGLKHETLFLTVNLTDRYFSRTQVVWQQVQLVGVSALLVASKFEEIHPPTVSNLVHITANAYTKREIMDMEISILSAVAFKVSCPTAAHFLLHLQAAQLMLETCSPDGPRSQVHVELAWYVMKLALLDVRMIRFVPSHLAAASLLLGGRLMGRQPAWPDALARISGRMEGVLEACVCRLLQLLEAAPRNPLQAIRSQYRHIETINGVQMCGGSDPDSPENHHGRLGGS